MDDTPPNHAEVAHYVADCCAEALVLVQSRPGLQVLAFLIDTTRIEAERIGGIRTRRRLPNEQEL